MNKMETLIGLLLSFGFYYIVIMAVTITSSWHKYAIYERVFAELSTYKFCRNRDHVYNYFQYGLSENFCWYRQDGSFQIERGIFIHSSNFFDPISRYWRKKYIKWCKENINYKELPTLSDLLKV